MQREAPKNLFGSSSSDPKSPDSGQNPPWTRQRNSDYASSSRTNSDSKSDNFGLKESSRIGSQQIIGSFEHVGFPEFGITDLIAKVDTGAYSGSLHCTKVYEEVTEAGKLLHFSPFDNPEVTVTADDYSVNYVRSSNGERAKRYFVSTIINIRGRAYPIRLSLANRSDMRWPVLIGRKFLRKHRFIVDVRQAKPKIGQREA